MENLTTEKNVNKYWPWIHAFGFFALFAMQMTQYYYCNFYAIWFPNRYALVAAVFMVLYYVFRGFKDGKAVKTLTLYSIWVLITRIISGDFMNGDDLLFSTGMFICVFSLALAYQLNKRKRQAVISLFTIVFIGIITLVAAVGIYAAVIQKAVTIRLPVGHLDAATWQPEGGVLRLRIADAHPNISACWVFLGIFLLINRFFSCKNKWTRVIIIIGIVIDYLAMSLTNCRTIYACFSICTAMLVYLLIANKYLLGKTYRKIVAFLLSVVIIAPVAYKSIDISLKGINLISQRTAVEDIAADDDTLYENTRDVTGEGSTITPRILIWKSSIDTVKQEPLRLLIGSSKEKLTNVSDSLEYIYFHVDHYHNMLLNILMLTGIPGLLIAIAFLFDLIRKMIILFFSEEPEANLAEKTLTLPLAGYILYGATLEVLLFTETDVRAFAFFLLAGVR